MKYLLFVFIAFFLAACPPKDGGAPALKQKTVTIAQKVDCYSEGVLVFEGLAKYGTVSGKGNRWWFRHPDTDRFIQVSGDCFFY